MCETDSNTTISPMKLKWQMN